jgi:hypothetical protein
MRKLQLKLCKVNFNTSLLINDINPYSEVNLRNKINIWNLMNHIIHIWSHVANLGT